MDDIRARLARTSLNRVNPFTKREQEIDEDDYGDEVDIGTIAGGGHGARQTDVTKNKLHVSSALRSFLVSQGAISEADAELESDQLSSALRALVDKPHINVPPHVTDRLHPLPEYFISSSHNTYLLAHQLFGKTSASAYETALNAGSRCIEIDAWDNSDDESEPKVTHGYTLVSHIPFRAVCETIRDVVDKEAAQAVNEQGYRAAPILLSLENHCGPHGQLRLVEIMKEVWGHRLLSEAVRQEGHAEQAGEDAQVTLDQLGSKIVVIVEYHMPDEAKTEEVDEDDGQPDDNDEEEQAIRAYKENKKAAPATGIIPELAALGLYAQSVKPTDNSWFEENVMKNGPHHHLINLSEVGLGSHLPANAAKIARHNSQHLMRVYPKGTRISSQNLQPVPFWAVGAQICALNWQTFAASMQLNEALFSGTDGYVLKPRALRTGGDGNVTSGKKKLLRLHAAGATDVPLPKDREADDIRPYLTCTLVLPETGGKPFPKRKTQPYKHHKLGFLHRGDNPANNDPVWDEELEWEFEDSELVFLRMMVKSDDSFARNPIFAVGAVRLLYVSPGWNFIRLLDLKGRETTCSLLVKFDIRDVEGED